MKLTHEICLDHDSTIPGATDAMLQRILDVMGHDPVNCSFVSETPDGVVHGRLIEILWCDSRILGLDQLGFRDGHVEVASAENIGAWFQEQGHRLMKIEGYKAFGNTIIKLQITEVDEPPMSGRETTLMRPPFLPSLDNIKIRLNALQ